MNTRDLPGSLDFVQCVDGKDTIIQDYAQVDGWQNAEVMDIIAQLEQSITTREIPPVPAVNFHITDDNIGEGGPKQKFARNIAAIETLFKLESENRNATSEEQEILSNYVGWGGLADAFDPETIQEPPERTVHMKKRIITFALAAALMLALGITAYAIWSIHAARQQELKADLKIEENNVSSYMEYTVPDDQASGLVLLSSVNDGDVQRVFVNISPVAEEDAGSFPNETSFSWSIDGTEIGGFAGPELPTGLTLNGRDEIRQAVLQYAYDKETQTMMLQCYIDVSFIEQAKASLGTDSLPLLVHMTIGQKDTTTFGPALFSQTEEQTRYFDFGHAVYHDEELDKDIEIVGLELTPFSAVWKVSYEGAEDFHTSGSDQTAYEPWIILEDKVCIETKLVFSDGSIFSTGGAMTSPYENGTVNLFCGWGSAINIDDVQRIVLGDLVLWEAK